MVKILYGNIVLDVCRVEKYVKYLPELNRFIITHKDLATGIMGSDNNTVYHLRERVNNFPYVTKTVTVEQINEEEFNELAGKILAQQEEDTKLKDDVESLKQMVTQQNFLIQQLLEKLGG